MKSERSENFEKLCRIMERLRGPDGCVWDRKQDSKSIKTYILEEAHELVEAVDKSNPSLLREELGDLLFLIIFMAQIATEDGDFDISDVMSDVAKKMIRRHPHVFGNAKVKTTDDVREKWQQLKAEEKKDDRFSVLDGVPITLPSLLRAHRLTERAAQVGFDWADTEDVFEKVEEELEEFRNAVFKGEKDEIEEEMGDLLFVLVNLARSLRINSEEALRASITKFIRRFQYIEDELRTQGITPLQATLEEMDKFWNKAKHQEKGL